MTSRRVPGSGDPHGRFGEWLIAGASDEPPRDVALHASVCPECAAQIAAFDQLTVVDTGRAPLPPSPQRSTATSFEIKGTARAVLAVAGVTVSTVALGIIALQAVDLGDLVGTRPEPSSPTQAVLGGAGGPTPTMLPTDGSLPTSAPSATDESPATAGPTAQAPGPTEPGATAIPATVRPATPRASSSQAATATTSASASATTSASATATASASATASSEPSASPTPDATPDPTPTPEQTPEQTADPAH
ncbi:MAG: hypothetical protein ACRDHD_06150 [Candidatus Limnocylindria bacterium]